MSALSVSSPFPIFTDIDGQPLEAGYVWIGTANLDPQVNPIAVYWDAALTIVAVQPIRTLGGYPANSGTPARLYVDSDYSIRVMNKNGSTVYSAPTATERYSDVVVGDINASTVIYDPAGVGAVATTVQGKLRESVSVLDFFANGVSGVAVDPTGVVDSTLGIQAAYNTNKKVFHPKGAYRITKTLVVPKFTSVTGEVGANIVADFTSTATWSGDFVAMRFMGLGVVDVTANDFNTVFEDLVISSINANSVAAIGVQVPHGATSASILEARTFCAWSNVMVVGFDIGYDLGQMSNSTITEIKARNVRIGINFVGKNVNVFMDKLNLFKGTPATSTPITTNCYGIFVASYFRGAVEERPEAFMLEQSLIASFYTQIYIGNCLLWAITDNVLDLGSGGPCINVAQQQGGSTITNNWIDSGGFSVGISALALNAATRANSSILLITGNSFSRCTVGVSCLANSGKIHVINNSFQASSNQDILLDSCDQAKIHNNDSISTGVAYMIYIAGGGTNNLDVAGNTSVAGIVLYTHPTNIPLGAVTIGRNKGLSQDTFKSGTATIPVGATSVDVTGVLMGSNNYTYPAAVSMIAKIPSAAVLSYTVPSYGPTSSAVRINSNIVAPVGGIPVRYVIGAVPYVDR